MYKYLLIPVVFAAFAAIPVPIVETCGTTTPKTDAELRAVSCPDGYVGQWYQERKANSCDWQPREPQWYACSRVIYPDTTNDPPSAK